jgi:hypothetical protein
MTHRIKTSDGRAAYALREQRVEPVFGIIKSVTGFRQFLTRRLDNVQGEWTLVWPGLDFKPHGGLAPEIRENRRKGALFREKRLVCATNDPGMTRVRA